jgi:outer membrane protein OmpA-like peptidoglycan-associated protein
MKKTFLYTVALAFVALFSSCNNKMGELSSDYFTVAPSVLELKAGKVDAVITAKFPEKYFDKKSTVTVTPVLVAATGEELQGTPVTYQGEKVKSNNKIVKYKAGGVTNQEVSFNYDEKYKKSALYVDFLVKRGKKEYKLPRVKVADGIITTCSLVGAESLTPAFAADKFEKSIQESYSAEIKFLIQQSNIRPSELKSAKLDTLLKKLEKAQTAKDQKVLSMQVLSYASPDGTQKLNAKLAEKRQESTKKYLKKEFKKKKIATAVDTKFTAEDWDGFQQLVQASNIQDKDLILRVLSTYSDPDKRDSEIKKISTVYTKLAQEILPQLRRSSMKVTLEVLGKSNEQILSILRDGGKDLSADEILYGATLTNSNEEKGKFYEILINKYPQDWRGYNNLGAIRFSVGDLKNASALFQKSYGIDSKNPETNYNLGLISLANKDYKNVVSYFGQSAGMGNKLTEAYGVMQIQLGNYSVASKTLMGTNSNATALAQLLLQDSTSASKTLAAIANPNATTDYLKAVIAARASDKDLALSNLKSSVSKDASMAKKASNDIEFAKFFTDATFLSIVKK